jgi:hypothetical protein
MKNLWIDVKLEFDWTSVEGSLFFPIYNVDTSRIGKFGKKRFKIHDNTSS